METKTTWDAFRAADRFEVNAMSGNNNCATFTVSRSDVIKAYRSNHQAWCVDYYHREKLVVLSPRTLNELPLFTIYD